MSITNEKYGELIDLMKGERIKDVIEALCDNESNNGHEKECDILYKAWHNLNKLEVIKCGLSNLL